MKKTGPKHWKAQAKETALEALERMKALEAQLKNEEKLISATLPDGCVIEATKERYEIRMSELQLRV